MTLQRSKKRCIRCMQAVNRHDLFERKEEFVANQSLLVPGSAMDKKEAPVNTRAVIVIWL